MLVVDEAFSGRVARSVARPLLLPQSLHMNSILRPGVLGAVGKCVHLERAVVLGLEWVLSSRGAGPVSIRGGELAPSS